MSAQSPEHQKVTPSSWSFLSLLETIFPLCLAILAAMLSINDLLSNNVGSLEIKLGNLRNSSYQWFQSKGIKATISEGQRDLLETLIASESIKKDNYDRMRQTIGELEKKISRYNMEKDEILLGSAGLKPEAWVQDINGQKGKVVGSKEYDKYLETLDMADNAFGLASMVFQIALVIGAIGIMLKKPKIQISFFFFMLTLGGIGIYMAINALMIAKTVPFF